MKEKIHVIHPEDILPLLKKWMKKKEENFLVITLNGAHEVIKVHHITKGLVNRTIIHPREAFFPCIKDYATSLILCHNHPSGGHPEPSKGDDEITERLAKAAHIMGFNLLDHIIIEPNGTYSSYKLEGKLREYQNRLSDEDVFSWF